MQLVSIGSSTCTARGTFHGQALPHVPELVRDHVDHQAALCVHCKRQITRSEIDDDDRPTVWGAWMHQEPVNRNNNPE